LSAHPLGKAFIADFKALEKRHAALEAGQREKWRDEIIAQAQVDAVDDQLDDATRSLSRELTYLDGPKSGRVRRYFPKPASRFVTLGLQSQTEVVTGWPQSLKAEAEAGLKKLGATFAALLAAARKALSARSDAAAARADHRVREIFSFIEDHNRLRLATHAALTTAALAHGEARDLGDRFFRRDSRSIPAEAEAPVAPTPQE
jgi:hypothetical protein